MFANAFNVMFHCALNGSFATEVKKGIGQISPYRKVAMDILICVMVHLRFNFLLRP